MNANDLQSIFNISNFATRLERERCAALCDDAMDLATMSCYATKEAVLAAREMAERIKCMIEGEEE